jgi:type VI protein secretion system component VasK
VNDAALVAGRRRWCSLTGLCLAAVIVWFAAANLPVPTPAIADDLGASLKIAAVFSLLALVAGLVLVPRGILHKDRQSDAAGSGASDS